MTQLLSYLLCSMGLTVLLVWPTDGPGAWIRERVLRRVIPKAVGKVLDCYICCSFWCGLMVSIPWWSRANYPWIWAAALMPPALFWIFVGRPE